MFAEGRENVNDENIDEVKKIVLVNRRITDREVAEDLNISIGSCHSILPMIWHDTGRREIRTKIAQFRPNTASH